jgi:hypothetical protein
MIRFKRADFSGLFLTAGILILYFLYFAIFNRYHILSLEQNQLFLWSSDFFRESFTKTGGLPVYIGSFLTQFFISQWAGSLIITILGFTAFSLTTYIFRKHNINSIILAVVPVWLLSMLQSNELFMISQSAGFLLLLLYFTIYISIDKPDKRYLVYFIGWPIMYFLSGGFSMPAVLMCALHESLFRKQQHHRIIAILFLSEGAIIPYILGYLHFYIPLDATFTFPVIEELTSFQLYLMILMLTWIPLAVSAHGLFRKMKIPKGRLMARRGFRLISGILVFLIMLLGVYKFGYNNDTEMLLGIDQHARLQEWDEVLRISGKFPYPNRLVIYYTDLALSKTGQLLDRMFFYPQTGSEGLRLKWEHNSNLIFGGDIFYYLSYTSEANRWAFEAMVAKGLNPRVLKRLITASIINGETGVAKKYLNILSNTLFYRNFARQRLTYLNDPVQAENDPDISRNKAFLITSDFVSNPYDLNLFYLLKNHPDNKMAYEYLLASLLLDKRLDAFSKVFSGFSSYDYNKLPVHVEEALLLYSLEENKNPLPKGFSIRPETIQRFRDYGTIFAANKKNREAAEKALKKDYGHTYWYYIQFINKK